MNVFFTTLAARVIPRRKTPRDLTIAEPIIPIGLIVLRRRIID